MYVCCLYLPYCPVLGGYRFSNHTQMHISIEDGDIYLLLMLEAGMETAILVIFNSRVASIEECRFFAQPARMLSNQPPLTKKMSRRPDTLCMEMKFGQPTATKYPPLLSRRLPAFAPCRAKV